MKEKIKEWFVPVVALGGILFWIGSCVNDSVSQKRTKQNLENEIYRAKYALSSKYNTVEKWFPERRLSYDIDEAIKTNRAILVSATVEDIKTDRDKIIGSFSDDDSDHEIEWLVELSKDHLSKFLSIKNPVGSEVVLAIEPLELQKEGETNKIKGRCLDVFVFQNSRQKNDENQ